MRDFFIQNKWVCVWFFLIGFFSGELWVTVGIDGLFLNSFIPFGSVLLGGWLTRIAMKEQIGIQAKITEEKDQKALRTRCIIVLERLLNLIKSSLNEFEKSNLDGTKSDKQDILPVAVWQKVIESSVADDIFVIQCLEVEDQRFVAEFFILLEIALPRVAILSKELVAEKFCDLPVIDSYRLFKAIDIGKLQKDQIGDNPAVLKFSSDPKRQEEFKDFMYLGFAVERIEKILRILERHEKEKTSAERVG